MNLLYTVYDGILGSVFESQVVRFLTGLRRREVHVTLAAFDSWHQRTSRDYAHRRHRLDHLLGRDSWFAVRLPILGRPGLLVDALRLAFSIRHWVSRTGKPRLIHCRGQAAAYLALEACRMADLRIPVIADFRGAADSEIRTYEPPSIRRAWKLREIARIDRQVCRRADHVLTVSTPLARMLARRHRIEADRLTVIPTCVETARFSSAESTRQRIRREMAVDEDILLVVYCGSLWAWGYPAGLLDAFQAIRRIDHRAHFLALTPDVEAMASTIERAGIPDAARTIRKVDHHRVADYLAASDIALLIREQNWVNAVACPTKFAEYLAAGLPVVLSPGIGDLGRIVTEEGVGQTWTGTEDLGPLIERIRTDRAEVSARCRDSARRLFDLDNHLDRLRDLYALIGRDTPCARS